MEILTQNDYFVAICALALRHQDGSLDEATAAFMSFFRHQRPEEELRRLVEMADEMEKVTKVLPTPEQLHELSEIYLDLPKDGWELTERQANSH